MRFLLTEREEKKSASGALPAGLEPALTLPFAALRGAAELKRAAAKAAHFPVFCFAAPRKAEDWNISAQGRRFIAAHCCLLLAAENTDTERGETQAAACGFRGILLSGDKVAPVYFSRALRQIKEAGLQAGFLGAWQAADIPRLLAFSPHYLGFSGSYQRAFTAARALAAARQKPGKAERQSAGKNDIMDKILVSDFIAPMHIGAYAHEKQAAQRVCFNVCAELKPAVGKPPRAVADIFSYDIILDAISRMAAEEHIELAETAAEKLAAFLLTYQQIARVTVRVEKLDLSARAVGVEITRSRRQNGAANAVKSRARTKG